MAAPLHLFAGFGIELEYMIVEADSLKINPIADRLIFDERGDYEDVLRGPIDWSNELVNHVIELKTHEPAPGLGPVAAQMDQEIQYINKKLSAHGARLLPTAMHPLMLPLEETQLWPHAHSAIYAKYDEIFGCKGHGWSNLQSMHINLPFSGDEEFAKLHAAVRLILPLLPALAASSPIVEGRVTGIADNRLEIYRDKERRIPSTTGHVVPEPAFTRKDYEMTILARLYQDLSPFDPDGIIQHEWSNARGAIARFDRSAIEIRVLDLQECPRADLAIAQLIVRVLEAMVAERWQPLATQKKADTRQLAAILRQVTREGQSAVIADEAFLSAFGCGGQGPKTAVEVLRHLFDSCWPSESQDASQTSMSQALGVILRQGTLSDRIIRALGDSHSERSRSAGREKLRGVYRELAACLAEGRQLMPS